MGKYFKLIYCFLILNIFTSVAVLAQPIEIDIGLSSEEKEWLANNKTIKVAAAITFTPMEFVTENGQISGISSSYLQEISMRLGIDFVWAKNKNWGDGVEMVKSGEADILTVATPSVEREKFLIFSDVYLSLSHVIYSRKGGLKFRTMEDLSGYTVALSRGTQIISYILENYPEINIVEVDSTYESLRYLTTGLADAYIGDIPSVTNSLQNLGYTNIIISGTSPHVSNNSMATRKDLPLLASAMQKALDDISQSRKDEILDEWIVIDSEIEPDYELIWKVAVGVLFFIAFILFWLNKLHHEVERRKIVEKELLLSQEQARKSQAEAEAANAAKSNFLANMSHEIRTPLNAIMGFSEVMEAGLFGEIKQEKYKEYLSDIRGSGAHLAQVIKNILDLSKIEAGKWLLESEEYNLSHCIDEALTITNQFANEKNINQIHKQEGEFTIKGDSHAIKRVLINLLSNSIKFTPKGGEVCCCVKTGENKDNVIIEVRDNGIGIPADKIEFVQTEFGQVKETRKTNENGTGLGLSIVRSLVELHNGKFTLESEEGKGTLAIVSLPALM